ncbi:EamA family transporter [Vibrio fluvialis]|uniref:SMR family transporter n=1 Tax=Vibrio fluvialis TaxID=676 RepID=UPI00192B9494|nr:SMR family transporter [Vibrio fluvialis]MBL4280043.1 EamA family transporter [Vibrio fluvialis]
MSYVYLLLAIFATSFGMVCYKRYFLDKTRMNFILSVLLFVAAPAFSYGALQEIDVDVVYVATSLNSLVVLFLSGLLLKEKIRRNQIIGCVVITLGVFIYMV